MLFEHLNLRPIHADREQARDKRAEDLAEDVARDLFPGEALPDGEADGDGGVEVAAGGWGASNNGEGNSNCKGPADLEEGAKCGNTDG